MINNKGYNFASDYWSHNVYQQAKNAITSPDKNPYGVKGDENWEYIALSEGWANYRQWKMSKQYLKYNSLARTSDELSNEYSETPRHYKGYIQYRYAGFIFELNDFLSDEYIEKLFAKSNSIDDLEYNLIKDFPQYKTRITNTYKRYE